MEFTQPQSRTWTLDYAKFLDPIGQDLFLWFTLTAKILRFVIGAFFVVWFLKFVGRCCSTVLCLHNQLHLNLIFFIKKQCNSYSNFIKRYAHPKERNFYVINEEMSVISRLFSMQKIFFLF